MPKINVYLPDELAAAVRDAQLPVSAICQAALEQAVRAVASACASDGTPADDRPAAGVFARYTARARRVLTLAEDAAAAIPHNAVAPEHVLLGILDEGSNLALKVLDALDVEPADLRAELVASMPPANTTAKERGTDGIPFAPMTKEALEATTKEALSLGHNYIGCEHLLLGLLTVEDGLASRVLRRMGVELRTTRRAGHRRLGELLRVTVSGSGNHPTNVRPSQ